MLMCQDGNYFERRSNEATRTSRRINFYGDTSGADRNLEIKMKPRRTADEEVVPGVAFMLSSTSQLVLQI
ncbi:hypothetical protein COP2_002173 [Malus domestica]